MKNTNNSNAADERAYRMAHAAGWDAANRNMAAAGRSKWSKADFNVAAAVMNRILDGVAK